MAVAAQRAFVMTADLTVTTPDSDYDNGDNNFDDIDIVKQTDTDNMYHHKSTNGHDCGGNDDNDHGGDQNGGDAGNGSDDDDNDDNGDLQPWRETIRMQIIFATSNKPTTAHSTATTCTWKQ